MATKADFAQKLLQDLRLRKDRMASVQTSDTYGNSRQNFKGPTETRMTDTVGTKAGSRYSHSGNNQTTAIVQAANQIVPYDRAHQSGQIADLSMALAYAFDGRGKLKRLDIASNGAMINVLQQIGNKSMQQSLEIQWKSASQFPTLTNLHIDEIAKGTQKLNQILRACSNGINIDQGSTDVGKELWKGAKELEQSLRMLVSLQEALDNSVSQQSNSRIKLLDDNGDSEDESIIGSLEERKKVERPVFSFDKHHKNSKASVQTNVQQNLTTLQPLPHLKDPNSISARHESISSKGNLHRRSASCGSEIETSQLTNPSKPKHNAARLPNVIAKLMGLEEPPQNMNPNVATESPVDKQRSRVSISNHTTQKSSTNADTKSDYSKNANIQVNQNRSQSNKITTVISHKIELQDAYKSTNGHKTTPDLQTLRMDEEEREGMKNYVRESKAAIFKINELQSKIIHLKQDDRSQKDVNKEENFRGMKQKQQVADATENSENRISAVAETMQKDTMGNANKNEIQKRAEASKPLLQQQKQNRDFQQAHMPYESQGKKLKAENRNQEKENQKSELRKRGYNGEKLQTSRAVERDLRILQKHLPTKESSAGKKKEDTVLAVTKTLLSNKQNEDGGGKPTNSDDKKKRSVGLKFDQRSPSTVDVSESRKAGVCANSNKDEKCGHNSARMGVGEIKPPEASSTIKTNVEITKTITAPRTVARTKKAQRSTSYRAKQRKFGKINTSSAATEKDEIIPKTTEKRKGNDESWSPPAHKVSQQNVDAEQMDTKYHAVIDEPSLNLKEVTKLLSDVRGENTISTVSDDQQEQLVSEEVGFKPQIIATAGQEECTKDSNDKQKKPISMEKQLLLTEDEMFLKQILIKSHLFLNTAEALFKLNIPISILNYASDQTCEQKDGNITQDCGYELLKKKGRQQGIIYPSINTLVGYTKLTSLDDLVRQLHKDFEILQSFGRSEKNEYDYVNHILKMLESDIHNKHPDLNSSWDIGWSELMFPCARMDEEISNIERLLLDELMEDLINDCRDIL